MTQPPFRPQLPAKPPSQVDLDERDRFQKLVADSLPSVRASAETWRNGLVAFITLVTTAVVIKGRDSTSSVPAGWRIAITVLVALGLAVAVLGLWQALAAQAGARPQAVTLSNIHQRYGSVEAYEVSCAMRAARKLDFARYSVASALALLLVGIALTWWAPAEPADPPAYLEVDRGHEMICGELVSADGGWLRLDVQGRHDAASIRLTEVTNVVVVANCE